MVHKYACHTHATPIHTQITHTLQDFLPRWLWSLSAIAPAKPFVAQPLPAQQTVVHERLSAHAAAPTKEGPPAAWSCIFLFRICLFLHRQTLPDQPIFIYLFIYFPWINLNFMIGSLRKLSQPIRSIPRVSDPTWARPAAVSCPGGDSLQYRASFGVIPH